MMLSDPHVCPGDFGHLLMVCHSVAPPWIDSRLGEAGRIVEREEMEVLCLDKLSRFPDPSIVMKLVIRSHTSN